MVSMTNFHFSLFLCLKCMHTYKIGLVQNNHNLWPWNTTACVACVKTQILGQNIYIGNENVATALHCGPRQDVRSPLCQGDGQIISLTEILTLCTGTKTMNKCKVIFQYVKTMVEWELLQQFLITTVAAIGIAALSHKYYNLVGLSLLQRPATQLQKEYNVLKVKRTNLEPLCYLA